LFIGGDGLFPVAEKILPLFVAVIFPEREGFFALVAIREHHHAARIVVGAAAAKGDAVRVIEPQGLDPMGEALAGEDQLIELFNLIG
jgi:hypothetical protein